MYHGFDSYYSLSSVEHYISLKTNPSTDLQEQLKELDKALFTNPDLTRSSFYRLKNGFRNSEDPAKSLFYLKSWLEMKEEDITSIFDNYDPEDPVKVAAMRVFLLKALLATIQYKRFAYLAEIYYEDGGMH